MRVFMAMMGLLMLAQTCSAAKFSFVSEEWVSAPTDPDVSLWLGLFEEPSALFSYQLWDSDRKEMILEMTDIPENLIQVAKSRIKTRLGDLKGGSHAKSKDNQKSIRKEEDSQEEK